jgi:hypothetical protein
MYSCQPYYMYTSCFLKTGNLLLLSIDIFHRKCNLFLIKQIDWASKIRWILLCWIYSTYFSSNEALRFPIWGPPPIWFHVHICTTVYTYTTDISQYTLCFGFSLLFTDRVPFELLDSAALLWRESCGGGGQIVFLNFTTII